MLRDDEFAPAVSSRRRLSLRNTSRAPTEDVMDIGRLAQGSGGAALILIGLGVIEAILVGALVRFIGLDRKGISHPEVYGRTGELVSPQPDW